MNNTWENPQVELEAFEPSPDELKSKDDVKAFRFAIFPMFFASFIPASIGFGCCVARHMFIHGPVGVSRIPMAIAMQVLICSFGVWVFSLCMAVKLSPEGIHGHSSWGIRRIIRWEEIQAAKPFRFLNIRFLRLYPLDGKSPIWMPLFLAKPDEFEQEVRRVAPAGNPILEHLQRR